MIVVSCLLDNYSSKKLRTQVVLDKYFWKSLATSCPGQLLFEEAVQLVVLDNHFLKKLRN